MSISWYECENMTQIHHFGCRGLSVAMIYGQGKIAESQGKVREFLFPDAVGTLFEARSTEQMGQGGGVPSPQVERKWK